MRDVEEDPAVESATAAAVCDYLANTRCTAPVDRSRPGLNLPCTAPLEELCQVLGSRTVGAVLVWDGRRLIGLIDRARLARFEADHLFQERRSIDVEDRS